MKKYIISIFAAGLFIIAVAMAQNPVPTLTGYTASLNGLVTSTDGKVDKSQAVALFKKGQPLVIVSKNKIYFVYNADGSYAGKKLAKFANGNVGVAGRVKKKNGVNFIIADKIFNVR